MDIYSILPDALHEYYFISSQQEVLDIARQLLVELGQNNDTEIEESKAKLEQLKTVLEM